MAYDLFNTDGKRCPCCGRILEHWQYYTSKTSKDGLQSYCKDCQRAYKRKHPQKEWKRKDKKDKTLTIW